MLWWGLVLGLQLFYASCCYTRHYKYHPFFSLPCSRE